MNEPERLAIAAESTPPLDLPGLFARTVMNFPDQVAVKSAGRELTYRQLDQLSGQLARSFRARLGSEPRPIAVLAENPVDVIVALIGVLRSGHFYSILASKLPPLRLTVILEDLQAPIILTDSSLKALAEQAVPKGCEIFVLDQVNAIDDSPFELAIPPGSLAGVYYTSGSTGEPKGVLREHIAIIQRGLAESELHGITSQDKLILTHALSATASLMTVFSAFFSGATLIIYEADKQGIAPLGELLLNEKITIFRMTVELLRYFLDGLPQEIFFPDVRVVMSAGDVLYRRDLERLWKHIPAGAVFIHHLAASESSILTRNILRSDTPINGNVVLVGLPLPGREILLLDETGQRVPTGEIGEICVRSQLQFPGYWHRPALTESKFIPDPDDPARNIYASGDLGRFRPDGQLEFIGRKDARVKIRGFSVDLSAIESTLMQIPEVRRAVVTTVEVSHGEKRLAAYVQLIKEVVLQPTTLRDDLAAKLPGYMVPSAILIVPQLPLTTTGKVDRKALPKPDWNLAFEMEEFTPPRTPTEEKLAGLWQKVLRLEKIGIHNSFFELGGDSLQAAALFSEIEHHFNQRLPLKLLIKYKTVSLLAAVLDNPSLPEASILVPLKTEGNWLPIILLPGAGADVLTLYPLAQKFSTEQPVYGLQFPLLDGKGQIGDPIEKIAALFIDAVKKVQPHGPYALVGQSFGGIVAFEMARQLNAGSETVRFLGMFDTWPPGHAIRLNPSKRIEVFKNKVRGLSFRGFWKYIAKKLATLASRLMRYRIFRNLISPRMLAPFIADDKKTSLTLSTARYRPVTTYPGNLTIFRAEQVSWHIQENAMDDWKRFVDGHVEIINVPGDHISLSKGENGRTLVKRIEEILNKTP